MYKLELLGKFNLPINVLKCELTPSRPSVIISDEDFSMYETQIVKLKQFIKYEAINEADVIVEEVKKTEATDVYEVPSIEETEEADENSNVINATGSSLTNSEQQVENTKTIEDEANIENTNIIDATDASKTNYAQDAEEAKNNEQVEEVVEISETVETEDTVTTVDGASSEEPTSKPTTKRGRRKK